jgi:hypothetical protein
MHAQPIIQDLLDTECPSIHAKRRTCVATIADAASKGGLRLMGISRVLHNSIALRHRIKRCDRLLGNRKLACDRALIYAAMTRRLLHGLAQPLIIIDWSDLRADRSQQVLRAALIVQGRALTLYEEVHPIAKATSLKVHHAFLLKLKAIMPLHCRPVFVTDAGFRSTWFALLDQMGYAWIGRIRNRDMVRASSAGHNWQGCKTLYAKATGQAKDLGPFQYVRNRPVACRLVLIRKKSRGRHDTTLHGVRRTGSQSRKQARAHKEPWLLVVSPRLAMSAAAVVAIYSGRMQIEQTFRDIKNPRWGLGLSDSQTRQPERLATLLLIGALACYALWLIALAVRASGYRIEFGSKKKAAHALSLISLARWWIAEQGRMTLSRRQLDQALKLLRSMALVV